MRQRAGIVFRHAVFDRVEIWIRLADRDGNHPAVRHAHYPDAVRVIENRVEPVEEREEGEPIEALEAIASETEEPEAVVKSIKGIERIAEAEEREATAEGKEVLGRRGCGLCGLHRIERRLRGAEVTQRR
jgi:hypothetical protein